MPALHAPPSVNIARLTYLLVCEAAGVAFALSTKGTFLEVSIATGLVGGLVVGAFFILIESLMRGFTLRGFSTATFGLGVGLFCAWLLTRVEISQLLEQTFRDRLDGQARAEELVGSLRLVFDVALFASFGFIGAVLALRGSRDDFAFIIPYVRFRQDAASGQPVVLDMEAVMDGRVLGVMRAGFLHGRIIIPAFVLDELQALVDGKSPVDRQRGQRGLDALAEIRKASDVQVTIHDDRQADATAESQTRNSRMIEIARLLGARLMTLDDNLAKIARLQGLDVLNLNELNDALKPPVVIGQRMRLAIVRPGKEDHQAVGYLPDGTMVVVNQSVTKIGQVIDVSVVSTLQTASGLLIFAEPC